MQLQQISHRNCLGPRSIRGVSLVNRQNTISCTAYRASTESTVTDNVQYAVKQCLIGLSAVALSIAPIVAAPPHLSPPAYAGMLSQDPIKNANALLRYALPIDSKNPIRRVQKDLEHISEALRIPGSKSLGPVAKSIRSSSSILDKDKSKIFSAFAPGSEADGEAAFNKLKAGLVEFQAIVDAKDKEAVPVKQQELLSYVGQIEQAMVKGFPFQVPSQYSNLPQLLGRANLEMKVKFAEPREDNTTGGLMKITVDGYNAPLSAGDFVDLAKRGFYNGMEIQRADGFVVQTGRPEGEIEGFVESNGEVRRIPFEVMVEGDKVPVYEETLEDNGRFNEQPVLPFNAFGTMALARAEFEANSASSQFFFLLKESELTPTGSNLLDGRYAVFGYVTEGQDLLKDLQVGDKIEYVKVTGGLDNLKAPASS